MKQPLKKTLDKIGILLPIFRLKEYLKSRRFKNSNEMSKNLVTSYPLPPSTLRVLVVGHGDPNSFLQEGSLRAMQIEQFLKKNNLSLKNQKNILDFGCGCARVLRHLGAITSADLYGCDYNKNLIEWCDQHLPFAKFKANNLSPPLPYNDNQFSLIYSISVFTHLTEVLQYAWIDELNRVLVPGGHLIFSFHGSSLLSDMSQKEKKAFLDGDLIIRFPGGVGSNLCSAFHPFQWIEKHLTRNFEIIDHINANPDMPQDMILMRKVF